jgi:hypothetical protein
LVHELKEEDLNNHKRKIAKKKAAEEQTSSTKSSPRKGSISEDTSASDSSPAPLGKLVSLFVVFVAVNNFFFVSLFVCL